MTVFVASIYRKAPNGGPYLKSRSRGTSSNRTIDSKWQQDIALPPGRPGVGAVHLTPKGVSSLAWILLTLIGSLSVVIVTQGDTRRYLLQGAFVGSAVGVIFLVGLLLWFEPR